MKKITSQLGFTMIELLIVIAILGILAVAVLSAINPIEQINRGRDTGSQSDAEQLLSSIDRYNAFQGYFPWQVDADDLEGIAIGVDDVEGNLIPIALTTETVPSLPGATETCSIFDRLSIGIDGFDPLVGDEYISNCNGAQEIKQSFVTRLLNESTRTLYLYNGGDPGGSTYVCFIPQSGAFTEQANVRCVDSTGAGMPEDLSVDAATYICGGSRDEGEGIPMVCLP